MGKFDNVYSVALGVAPVNAAVLVDNFIAKLEQEECAVYYKGSYNNGM
jgi:hypothetical protein